MVSHLCTENNFPLQYTLVSVIHQVLANVWVWFLTWDSGQKTLTSFWFLFQWYFEMMYLAAESQSPEWLWETWKEKLSITFTTVSASVSVEPEDETYPVSAGELLMYQVRLAGGAESGETQRRDTVSPREYLQSITHHSKVSKRETIYIISNSSYQYCFGNDPCLETTPRIFGPDFGRSKIICLIFLTFEEEILLTYHLYLGESLVSGEPGW